MDESEDTENELKRRYGGCMLTESRQYEGKSIYENMSLRNFKANFICTKIHLRYTIRVLFLIFITYAKTY